MTHPLSLQTHIFVHYEPDRRGFRSAVAFLQKNKHYYGFYMGYCGGGCQGDYFFRFSTDLKDLKVKYAEEWDNNEEVKYIYEAMSQVSSFFDPDRESWTEIHKPMLKKMRKEKNNENKPVYYYETPNFPTQVLQALSERWSLLTFY